MIMLTIPRLTLVMGEVALVGAGFLEDGTCSDLERKGIFGVSKCKEATGLWERLRKVTEASGYSVLLIS